MKKILFIVLVSLSLINFSCKKDCVKPVYPVEGLWIGTYSFAPSKTSLDTSQYFSFVIKPNGQLIVEAHDRGVDYTANGTWTLTNHILSCRYTYVNSIIGTSLRQAATATFDNTGTLSDGVWYNTDINWQKTSEPDQEGTFSMKRVN